MDLRDLVLVFASPTFKVALFQFPILMLGVSFYIFEGEAEADIKEKYDINFVSMLNGNLRNGCHQPTDIADVDTEWIRYVK